MASVSLEFTAPAQANLVALRIYEAATELGVFGQIERVTAIGSFPGYITSYTTANAVDAVDGWFTIAWEDDEGGLSEQSEPAKGGTQTVPGEIADRVLQRDGSLNRSIAVQEAEAALENYFGGDPYELVLADIGYRQLRGFTNFVLAAMLLTRFVSGGGSAEQITVGLITLKSSSGGGSLSMREVQSLIDRANNDLGLNQGMIIQLERCLTPTYVELMEP